MSQTVIILGVNGRFGRAAAQAFLDAGWSVRGLARHWPGRAVDPRIQQITGDAFDPGAVSAAAFGSDVIVNALNPPYPDWARDLPRLTASVLAAARASGATVMIPGNVYNYGAAMPAVLTEDTPHRPTTRKGRLRQVLEDAYATASADGVQTIILRAGDFIERERTSGWFDAFVAARVAQGKVTYPGPLDRLHAWAYLPDMARALVGLAEKRAGLPAFSSFGFEGFNITGAQLVAAMERVARRPLKVTSMPWPVMAVIGLVSPMIREVTEMRYLWQTHHSIDGSRLAGVLPAFHAPPLETALADAMAA